MVYRSDEEIRYKNRASTQYIYTVRKVLRDFVIYNCGRYALVNIDVSFRYISLAPSSHSYSTYNEMCVVSISNRFSHGAL
jgi:hypothetical protein